jgi:XTP/dITP diphosphohydrolase
MAGHPSHLWRAEAGSRLALRIVCATANRHKLAEIRAILQDLPIMLLSLEDFSPFPVPEETGGSYAENALIKARAVYARTGTPTLADDTGLEVKALAGRPGIHSQRYAADDNARRSQLLQELAGVPPEGRKARFICAVAYVDFHGEQLFQAEVAGRIAEHCTGQEGFGYDPLFFLPHEGKTYAEMSALEKNALSHRGKALASFRQWLFSRGLLVSDRTA